MALDPYNAPESVKANDPKAKTVPWRPTELMIARGVKELGKGINKELEVMAIWTAMFEVAPASDSGGEK